MGDYLAKTSPQNKIVLNCRLNSKGAWNQISKDDLDKGLIDLIYRTCVISGLPYPPTQILFDYLVEEIKVLLTMRTKYKTFSIDEIILSVRINSQGDWKYISNEEIPFVENEGDYLNVNYFSAILKNYWSLRIGIENSIGNIIDGYN